MSLYNKMFGFNHLAPAVLNELGVSFMKATESIPRFRDAFIDKQKRLVIYTRTGGSNREFYEHASEENEGICNDKLRELPGFLFDEDDPYDETFALFRYEILDERVLRGIEALEEEALSEEPADRFARVIDKMKNVDPSDSSSLEDNPELARAMAVGRAMVEKISSGQSDETKDGVDIIYT